MCDDDAFRSARASARVDQVRGGGAVAMKVTWSQTRRAPGLKRGGVDDNEELAEPSTELGICTGGQNDGAVGLSDHFPAAFFWMRRIPWKERTARFEHC